MTPRLALRDGFKLWLDAVASGPKIKIGRRLYPFATSMRSTARMVLPLEEISEGRKVTGDARQAITDLGSAGLVAKSGPNEILTDLGQNVLSRWQELQIANAQEVDEAARCAALVRAGVAEGNVFYRSVFGFWSELVELAPAEYWFSDIYTLCLPSYLDQPDPNGFNPFHVLAAANDGRIGTGKEWNDWAETDDVVGPALAKLLHRVKESFRVGGCLAFCRGMEAHRLATVDPERLVKALEEWGIAND